MPARKKTSKKYFSFFKPWVVIVILILVALCTLLYTKPAILKTLFPSASSLNTAEIATVYTGTLPCADCSGIDAELILYQDKVSQDPTHYIFKQTYQGKNVAPFIEMGTWTDVKGTPANKNIVVYQLTPENATQVEYFLPKGNTLEMLDPEKNPIDSPTPLILTKSAPVGLANPASVHCGQIGGATEILTDSSGNQYGMCLFSNGKSCEEWNLFRNGTCEPYKPS